MKNKQLRRYLSAGALIAGLTVAALFAIPAHMPPFLDEDGRVLPDSIAVIESVELNGVEQWLFIRGRNVNKPVLLFLHGGPGTPETAWLFHYNQSLADHFVVVAWEQRGAGKSYTPHIPAESMTMEQFIADAHALTQMLKERFNQEKIYLVGHSWGTLLGMHTAYRHPHDYHALVSISQTAHAAREEALIYEWVLAQARQDDNAKAVRQLEATGVPVEGRLSLADLSVKLKWVNHYGGGAFYGRNGFRDLVWVMLKSRVYTLKEKLLYFRGESFSLEHLYGEVSAVNLFAEIPEVQLPVYFLHGRHDYQVPMEVARAYFDHLQAPHKAFIVFEQSAHGVLFEEPEKFQNVLVRQLLNGGQNE
ncbi:MAG TPA: alpha/beta hydrolase [Candidatus Sulfomarinibacteraceae bacterium]|nr:alpha/beta hydrolase [Candidatus Sulfomarinibacteraceae bacterium]